jgi:hypothetical protein
MAGQRSGPHAFTRGAPGEGRRGGRGERTVFRTVCELDRVGSGCIGREEDYIPIAAAGTSTLQDACHSRSHSVCETELPVVLTFSTLDCRILVAERMIPLAPGVGG